MQNPAANTVTPADSPLELDYRAADGIEVALLWSKRTNRLWVAVSDTHTAESFELDVSPDLALDAFHHPYAYAVRHGVGYTEPVRA
jgi:hypothetical protein